MFSMFGKFLVHVWSWCGGFHKELLISVHDGLKLILACYGLDALMNLAPNEQIENVLC